MSASLRLCASAFEFLVLGSALAGIAHAQVQIVTIDGSSAPAGEPSSIQGLELRDAAGTAHDLARIRSIEYARKVEPPAPERAPHELRLASGDVVLGTVEEGDATTEYLFFRGLRSGRTGFPYHRIDLLSIRANPPPAPLEARIEGELRDAIFVKKEGRLERLNGFVLKFTAEKIRFDWDQVPDDDQEGRSITLSKLIAIRFALKPPHAIPDGVRARFHFTDGSRIWGTEVEFAEGIYRCKLAEGGEEATFPATELSRVEFLSDRVLVLSDTTPAAADEHDFLGRPSIFPFRRDRTVVGKPLRLASRDRAGLVAVEKGFGVHAYSRLTFDIHGRYRRFEAHAALDPHGPGKGGSVVFRVFGDGKLLGKESPTLSDPRDVHAFDLPVEGVRELILEVDFGENLDLGDHAVWANPLVIR